MRPDRRHFLLGSGSAIALGSLPAGACLAADKGQSSALPSSAGMVVYRQDNDASRYFATAMSQAGLRCLALSNDLVRQWRNELEPLLVEDSVPLFGLTDWSDYLLLRGLNAEVRRFPKRDKKLYVPVSCEQEKWAFNQALLMLEGESSVTDSTGGAVLFKWMIS